MAGDIGGFSSSEKNFTTPLANKLADGLGKINAPNFRLQANKKLSSNQETPSHR